MRIQREFVSSKLLSPAFKIKPVKTKEKTLEKAKELRLKGSKTFRFPKKLSKFGVGTLFVYVCSENSNFLVVNEKQDELFREFKRGLSLGEVYARHVKNEKDKENLKKLLEQLYFIRFFGVAPVKTGFSFSSRRVLLKPTKRCNLDCKFCFENGSKATPEVDFEKWSKFLKKWMDFNKRKYGDGKLTLIVSGGEPLLYKDLFKLLKEAVRLGYAVELITNGTLIDEKAIKQFPVGLEYVQISLDGSEKTHNTLRRRNCFKDAIKGIRLVDRSRIPLKISTTLTKESVSDVCKNYVGIIKKNVKNKKKASLWLKPVGATGRAKDWQCTFGSPEFAPLIKKVSKKVCEPLKQSGYRVLLDSAAVNRDFGLFNCSFGGVLIIEPDGSYNPCKCGEKFGEMNVFSNSLEEIAAYGGKLFERALVDKKPKCRRCCVRYLCLGKCSSRNFRKTGSLTRVVCDKKHFNYFLALLAERRKKYYV